MTAHALQSMVLRHLTRGRVRLRGASKRGHGPCYSRLGSGPVNSRAGHFPQQTGFHDRDDVVSRRRRCTHPHGACQFDVQASADQHGDVLSRDRLRARPRGRRPSLARSRLADATVLRRITEVAMLVSLFAIGLRLRVPPTDRIWPLPLRLGFLAMVLDHRRADAVRRVRARPELGSGAAARRDPRADRPRARPRRAGRKPRRSSTCCASR